MNDVSRTLRAVPGLMDLPATKMWVDYDEVADVLYLSFQRPQKATDSEMRDDGIIVHRRGKQIVGLTIWRPRRASRCEMTPALPSEPWTTLAPCARIRLRKIGYVRPC